MAGEVNKTSFRVYVIVKQVFIKSRNVEVYFRTMQIKSMTRLSFTLRFLGFGLQWGVLNHNP